LFDDDLHSTGTLANDKHREITFIATPQGKTCYITIQGKGEMAGDTPSKEYRLVIPATAKPSKVIINGKKAKNVTYEKLTGTLTIPVAIADVAETTIIEINK
jgi:hypothetical protein